MIHRFNAYFQRLEELATEKIDRSAEKLVRAEKRHVALLIAHIAEMSRRKGELELGYKNCFDYCVRRLRLSEGSVARRLQVANVSRRFPQILVALAENRISLTVAGLLAPHLTEDNVETLLCDCEGKSSRAVEEYLEALKPKPVFAPSIRGQPAHPKHSEWAQTKPSAEKQDTPSPASSPVSRPVLQAAQPEVFNFRFAADREFKESFERLAEVLGVENPHLNMAEIFAKAMEVALERKDPERKLQRRRAKGSQGKSRARKISQNAPAQSRHIASEVKERVHEKGHYQCEFRGPDGTRCRSRTGLEIEHMDPFAVFGRHDEKRLRLLCKRHNRFMAERFYGVEFIRRKIDERRSGMPPA